MYEIFHTLCASGVLLLPYCPFRALYKFSQTGSEEHSSLSYTGLPPALPLSYGCASESYWKQFRFSFLQTEGRKPPQTQLFPTHCNSPAFSRDRQICLMWGLGSVLMVVRVIIMSTFQVHLCIQPLDVGTAIIHILRKSKLSYRASMSGSWKVCSLDSLLRSHRNAEVFEAVKIKSTNCKEYFYS